jgi:hypothetical protein
MANQNGAQVGKKPNIPCKNRPLPVAQNLRHSESKHFAVINESLRGINLA